MKKIVSLIAAISMLFALSTSAFAFSGAVSGDASLEGTTITAGAEGFIFKYVADMDIKGGSSIKSDLAALINAGWVISDVDGVYAEDDDVTQGFATSPATQLQVKLNGSTVHATTGKAIFMFKATPVDVADGTSVTFQVTPTLMKTPSGIYNTKTTYTVVKAAAPASNVTAAIDANDVITVSGDSAIAGKKLVVSETTCSTVTANTRVKVTLGDDYKIFGENMWKECQIEGPGLLQSKTVAFGVIFTGDYAASDFDFEIIPDITTYNAN